MLFLWTLSQTQSTGWDWGVALQQIGIGALIAAPAWIMSWSDRKKVAACQEECAEKDAQRLADKHEQLLYERDTAARITALLQSASSALAEAPSKFDDALDTARMSMRQSEVERLLERLADTVADLERRSRG